MWIKKWIIIASTITLTSGILLPVALTTIINHQNQAQNNKKYIFDNITFNNKNELYNYAKAVATKNNYSIVDNDKWSIEYNNETLYFSNINDLFLFLENKILSHQATTSTEVSLNDDVSIDYSSLINLNLNNDNLNKMNIYRGRNNTYFTSEEAAKDSYLEIHDAYYFDGIYFRTKEELTAYLDLNYDSIINSKNNNIVIKSPSGEYSTPFNLEKLKNKDEQEIDKFITFINMYAKKYLQVKSNISNQNQVHYYDFDDIYNNIANVITNFEDPSFININSNQGKGNYLIDLNKDDKNNLYGPYYTQGTASLSNITNPDAWTRIEGNQWNFNDNQRISSLLSSFIDSFLYEDEEFPYPFGIEEIKDDTKKYFDYLKDKYPYVYEQVLSLYQTMKTGKRYSNFYKLPILFIKTIEELMYISASQNIIEITRSYYQKVAEAFDNRLYSFTPSVFLEPKIQGRNQKLSFVDLFHIKDKTFDLNTDIESFVDIVMNEYPNFVHYLKFYNVTTFYVLYMPQLYDYDAKLIQFVDNSFIPNSNYDEWYKTIWRLLNTSSLEIFENIVNDIYYQNTNNQLNDSLLQTLMCQSALFRDIYIQNVVNHIQKSIDEYLSSSDDFNVSVDSFFYNMNKQEIDSFINLYKFNNNQIDYKVFSYLKLYRYYYSYYSSNNLDHYNGYDGYVNFKPFVFEPFSYNDQTIVDKYKNSSLIFLNKPINIFYEIAPKLYGGSFTLYLIPNSELDFNIWDGFKLINNFLNVYRTIFEPFGDDGAFEDLSEFLTLLGDFCKPLVVIDMMFVLFDLFIPKTTKFSYYFETEGVKYIWDGGSETKILFGLVTTSNNTISNMKINEPIQVTKQHVNNAYYYNGKEYFDLNTLKKDQLYDILNGRFKYNDSIKTVYSFDQLNIDNNVISDKAFEGIGILDYQNDDLIDNIYNRVINLDKNITTQNVYSYANGFSFDYNISKFRNIEEIVSKIKPVKVTYIPYLDENNYPIANDNTLDDGSLPVYQLPAKSWISANGFSFNENKNYIVIDPNKENMNIDSEQLVYSLKQTFYQKFDVPYKTIIENDLYKYDSFSKYQTNIQYFDVFEVVLDNGYKKFFKDKSLALKWFMQSCNFTVYSLQTQIQEYQYNGLTFENLDAYLNWVLSVSEVTND